MPELSIGQATSLALITMLALLLALPAACAQQHDFTVTEVDLPENVTVVDTMTIDRSGNVWFMDSSGPELYLYEPDKNNFTEIAMPGLQGAEFTGMSVDASGKVWFADRDGNRVGMFDPATGGFKVYDFPLELAPSDLVFYNGFLWIGCKEEIGRLDIKNEYLLDHFLKKRNSYIMDVELDEETGDIWFVESAMNRVGGYLKRYNDNVEYDIPTPDSCPTCLDMDSAKTLWFIEAKTNRLGSFDTINEKFREHDAPAIDGKKPSLNHVAVDKNGHVWVTDPANNRLIKYFPEHDAFGSIGLKEGNNMPTLIDIDEKGNLWFVESGTGKLAMLQAGPDAGMPSASPIPSPSAEPSSTPKPSPGFSVAALAIAGLILLAFKKRL